MYNCIYFSLSTSNNSNVFSFQNYDYCKALQSSRKWRYINSCIILILTTMTTAAAATTSATALLCSNNSNNNNNIILLYYYYYYQNYYQNFELLLPIIFIAIAFMQGRLF